MNNIRINLLFILALFFSSCDELSSNAELQQCMIEKEELAQAFHLIKNENSSGSEKIISLIRSISDIQNRMNKTMAENNVKIIEIASFEHTSSNRVSDINKMMSFMGQSLKHAKNELYQTRREVDRLRSLSTGEKQALFKIIDEKQREIDAQNVKIYDLKDRISNLKSDNKLLSDKNQNLTEEVESLVQINQQLVKKKFVMLISKRGRIEMEIPNDKNQITFNFRLKEKNILNELNPGSYYLNKGNPSTIKILNWDSFWQDSPFLIVKGSSNRDRFWY